MYIFYCPIFVSSIFSSPPSPLPIIPKPVSVFFPATLLTPYPRVHASVQCCDDTFKINQVRDEYNKQNELDRREPQHSVSIGEFKVRLNAKRRSVLLIPTVSSRPLSHGQILCAHAFL